MEPLPQNRPHRLVLDEDRCDRELVLTLDGGGMRGYSSLLILEALMAQVAEAERGHFMSISDYTFTSLKADESKPLPAHYFDYAVGTSTGGLIAIMIGRLRMQIADCLKEYEKFGKEVFGKRRMLRWNQYDHRNLERVVKGVVEKYSTTKEHGHYAEFTKPEVTRSCRTAAMAVRRNPAAGDEAYIFRSYPFIRDPLQAPLDSKLPLNPDGNGKAFIWQVARATSAAPHFFADIEIDGNRFMDGAVQINNPSFRAWTEACNGHHSREGHSNSSISTGERPKKPAIGVFVSIGTGKAAPLTMFGGRNIVVLAMRIFNVAIKRLSDPEQTHQHMETLLSENETPYFRFNVEKGLENIKMDDYSGPTIHNITTATKDYLADPKIADQLRECAELLVAHRRGRNPTAQERQLRDLHKPKGVYNEWEDMNVAPEAHNDTDASGASSSTRAPRTSRLSTPRQHPSRSRSASTRSHKTYLEVTPRKSASRSRGSSRNRDDSAVSASTSSSFVAGAQQGSDDACPATPMEREFTRRDLLRMKGPNRGLGVGVNGRGRSCSP